MALFFYVINNDNIIPIYHKAELDSYAHGLGWHSFRWPTILARLLEIVISDRNVII